MPYLSVIVPVSNSQNTIEECLKAIKDSSYKDYELIVVDCLSTDSTVLIAGKYANRVIRLNEVCNRSQVRLNGINTAAGEIIVNVDSDVIIESNTLSKIVDYFHGYKDVDAVTGLLAKKHPNRDFFSQYKNIYMYYIFKKLPQRVNFLYGSIYAFKKYIFQDYNSNIKIADDTALGQYFVLKGRQIDFLKNLEVVHLKKYNIWSFIKNDFQIPFDWAKIFLKFKGWKQLGRFKTGYAHSPREQILSVISVSLIFLLTFFYHILNKPLLLILCLFLFWIFLNRLFFIFFLREKGLRFGFLAFFVTFIDNAVMATGIFFGSLAFFLSKIRLKQKCF